MRLCIRCGEPLPATKRRDAVYCSTRCGNRVRGARYERAKPEVIKARRFAINSLDARRIHSRIKWRAGHIGAPFDLTPEDIVVPEVCPVLGIPIEGGEGRRKNNPNSPSVDRIVPELGYVRGNVRVISNRANLLKSNATVAELEAVLADLRSLHGAGI